MTKEELIKKLQAIPGNPEIIMSRDAEGNSYSPFGQEVQGKYMPENRWSGDFYGGDDAPEKATDCICFFPG